MNIDRRHFLKVSSATTLGCIFASPRLWAEDAAVAGDKILVVVQLSGGNDGLSTVVPYGDDAYHKVRKATRIEKALLLDEVVGLHPNLESLAALYKEGKVAVVQGVSYPEPRRSHFESMDVWHTGDLAGRRVDTGWVGRSVDACCGNSSETNLVINVGNAVPYALNAERIKPVSFQLPENYRWNGRAEDGAAFADLNAMKEGETTAEWLHRVASAARASSAEVLRAATGYRPRVDYPQGALGRDLRTVAGLIHGGLGTRVFYVSLGGFDTHVRQKNAHDNLMRQLGDGLTAFHRDLVAQGHSRRVLSMVFSEFGRRVEENASGGTDHGVAGPMFFVGDQVNGGLHGKRPDLDRLDDNGDLLMTTDFRSAYAAVLDDWIAVDSRKILGGSFPKLKLIGA